MAVPEGGTTPLGEPLTRASIRVMRRPYIRTPATFVADVEWTRVIAAEEKAHNTGLAEAVLRAVDAHRAARVWALEVKPVYRVFVRTEGYPAYPALLATELDTGHWAVAGYEGGVHTKALMDTRALVDRLAEHAGEPAFHDMYATVENHAIAGDEDWVVDKSSQGWWRTYVPEEVLRLRRSFQPLFERGWFPNPADCDLTLGALIPFLKKHLRARLEAGTGPFENEWFEYLLDTVDTVDRLLTTRCNDVEFYHAYRQPTSTRRLAAIAEQ
jgi:hypothetical protein